MFRLRNTFAALLLVAALIFATTVPSVQAQGGGATFVRKQPTTAAMLLVSNNADRSSITIQNVGSVIVALGSASTVTYSTGQLLAPSQRVVFPGYTSALYGITNSGTADLRITETTGEAGPFDIQRLITTGISNGASTSGTIPCTDGTNLVACAPLIYVLATAITANSTTTATAAGTLAITSNATGIGSIFRSDGTNWQLLNNYTQYNASSTSVTTATTSTSDVYLQAPVTGSLTGIDFTSIDALAASDTNYITWTLVNLGQSGVGTTAMLAVADTNTTKTTGGTAITAVAKHALVVHGTAANLLVVKGDVLRLRATVTGTLVGTVTGSRCQAYFTRSV